MTTQLSARIRAHKANIDRYYRLLATQLTDHERRYIHNRIAQEQASLNRLVATQAQHHGPTRADPDTVIAASAVPGNAPIHRRQ